MAVIGASDTPGRPNTGIWRRLLAWACEVGTMVYPVNPTKPVVDGLVSYPSIVDIPDDIDVAAVLVADAFAAVASAIEKKARFAVVFSSGFAETGTAGRAAQDRLASLVAGSDLRLLGPNTNLNAFESFRRDLPGPSIALITQSGHQGRPVFQGQEIGIAMSYWAPTGNEVDLEFADFATWFADQPEVGVIAAYIEGFKSGSSLRRAADHCVQAGVPIVCVKVGRTSEGRSMAQSHTGKLTGADAVVSAAFRQHGITRVDGLDELLDVSQMLARARPPSASGVCVYSISGGTGAHVADLCSVAGLRLPPLSRSTQAALHEWIPSYLRVSNPVDNGGHPVGDERGRKILDALVGDPAVGALICPITGAFPPMSDRLAADLVAVAETTAKPVCVVWGSPAADEEAYRSTLLGSSRAVVFRTMSGCITAVRAWLDWHAFRQGYRSPFAGRETTRRRVRFDGLAARRALDEHESKELLAAYGIPVTRDSLVSSARDAVAAAERIGYPVVLKACSATTLHKSDGGLVRLGLASAREVRSAFAALRDASGGAPVLVCEQVAGGVECVVGVSRDPLFGPVVMFGLGGVFVEVLGDVSFRMPPFDRAEARRMVSEVRGFPLLAGARGRPPSDVGALVDVIMRVQRLALDHADSIAEVDINPLAVLSRGQGAVALDALVVPSVR